VRPWTHALLASESALQHTPVAGSKLFARERREPASRERHALSLSSTCLSTRDPGARPTRAPRP